MSPKAILLTAIGAVVVVAGAVVVWAAPWDDREQDSPPPVATAAPIAPGGSEAEDLDDGEVAPNDGVDADGGDTVTQHPDVEALEAPEGMPIGQSTVPDRYLTPEGTDMSPREMAVVAPDVLSGQNAYMILEIDKITAPLEGEAKSSAYESAGFPEDPNRIVQRVDLRARIVGGGGDLEATNLFRQLMPVNHRLQGMTVASITGGECSDATQPFAGLGASIYDTTVKVCFHAFGTVDAPQSPLSNIEVTSMVDFETFNLYVQTEHVRDADYLD